MADVAVNRSSQDKAITAPPRQIATRQPRAHGLGEPRRNLMRPFDLLGIGHLAKIDLAKIFGARSTFLAALASAILAGLITACGYLIGRRLAKGLLRLPILQILQGRAVCSLCRA